MLDWTCFYLLVQLHHTHRKPTAAFAGFSGFTTFLIKGSYDGGRILEASENSRPPVTESGRGQGGVSRACCRRRWPPLQAPHGKGSPFLGSELSGRPRRPAHTGSELSLVLTQAALRGTRSSPGPRGAPRTRDWSWVVQPGLQVLGGPGPKCTAGPLPCSRSPARGSHMALLSWELVPQHHPACPPMPELALLRALAALLPARPAPSHPPAMVPARSAQEDAQASLGSPLSR